MVHQYKLNGYNIVLDTCSGAVHSVDEVAYDIIADYDKKPQDVIVKELMEKYKDRDDVRYRGPRFQVYIRLVHFSRDAL